MKTKHNAQRKRHHPEPDKQPADSLLTHATRRISTSANSIRTAMDNRFAHQQ